jgi:hypothetical protein
VTLDIKPNECLVNNGVCWQDKAANIIACKVLPVVLIISLSLSEFWINRYFCSV